MSAQQIKGQLTAKQARFCREYVVDLNATQAAIRAGYSVHTAASIASENLTKPKIQKALQDLKAKAAQALDIRHQTLLEELHRWAFADITQTFALRPQDLAALPLPVRRLITKIKTTRRQHSQNGQETQVELTFVCKEKAMEMLCKHLGFFERDNRQKATATVTLFKIPDNGRN